MNSTSSPYCHAFDALYPQRTNQKDASFRASVPKHWEYTASTTSDETQIFILSPIPPDVMVLNFGW